MQEHLNWLHRLIKGFHWSIWHTYQLIIIKTEFLFTSIDTLRPRQKWPPFFRRQILFLMWMLCFVEKFTEICFQLTINQKLVQITAWHRKGDKPLCEPVMPWFTAAHMRHSARSSGRWYLPSPAVWDIWLITSRLPRYQALSPSLKKCLMANVHVINGHSSHWWKVQKCIKEDFFCISLTDFNTMK